MPEHDEPQIDLPTDWQHSDPRRALPPTLNLLSSTANHHRARLDHLERQLEAHEALEWATWNVTKFALGLLALVELGTLALLIAH